MTSTELHVSANLTVNPRGRHVKMCSEQHVSTESLISIYLGVCIFFASVRTRLYVRNRTTRGYGFCGYVAGQSVFGNHGNHGRVRP